MTAVVSIGVASLLIVGLLWLGYLRQKSCRCRACQARRLQHLADQAVADVRAHSIENSWRVHHARREMAQNRRDLQQYLDGKHL